MSLLRWGRGSWLRPALLRCVPCVLQRESDRRQAMNPGYYTLPTSNCLSRCCSWQQNLQSSILHSEGQQSTGLTFIIKNRAKQMTTARIFPSTSTWNLLSGFAKKTTKLYSSLGIIFLAFSSLLTYKHHVNLTQRTFIIINNSNSI